MVNKNFNKQAETTQDGEEKETFPTIKDSDPRSRMRFGELVEMSKKERDKLSKKLAKELQSYEDNTGTLITNLRRWNDLLEGVLEETDFPWEGSSNLHIPLVAIHLFTLHSVMARSMLMVEPIWFAKTLDQNMKDIIPEIEAAITFKSRSDWNIVSALRDVMWTTGRDGLGILQVPYVIDVDHIREVISVESRAEYADEFPDAESAGLTEDEYQTKLEEASKATAESPVDIPIEYDRIDYRGPKADVVEAADFVIFPATAPELKVSRGYGKYTELRKEDLKKMVAEKLLWKDEVVSLFEKKADAKDKTNLWRSSRDEIEGISREDNKLADDFGLFDLVYRMDLDKDGIAERYLVLYSLEKKKVLGVRSYEYGRDYFVLFRMLKRTNRLWGRSIIDMLEDMNHEVDASINFDINSGTIELSPMFKGKKSANKDFDPMADENQMRPGAFFMLDDPAAFEQLDISPKSKRESGLRRQEVLQYADLLVGPSQLLSGRESPIDPDAPGNKTIALIQQSNMRIEDNINEFRLGLDELGALLVDEAYRFEPDIIRFESPAQKGVIQELKRRRLRGDIRMVAHGVNATSNPDIECRRAVALHAILRKEPMIDQRPQSVREILNRIMLAGRTEGREKILPSEEEIREEQIEINKEAIKKLLKEQPQDPSTQALAKAAGVSGGGGGPGRIPPEVVRTGPEPAKAPGLPQGQQAAPGAPEGAASLPPIGNLPPVNGQ